MTVKGRKLSPCVCVPFSAPALRKMQQVEKSHCVNFFSVSGVSILTLAETFQKSHDGKRSNKERLGADLVAALLSG